jgi:hypothetical protein
MGRVPCLSADTKGYAGSNRWVEHQTRTLARLDQLCEIFDDPNIPVGTVIQPSKAVPASRLEQAANQRALRGPDATARAVDQVVAHALLPAPRVVTEEEVET